MFNEFDEKASASSKKSCGAFDFTESAGSATANLSNPFTFETTGAFSFGDLAAKAAEIQDITSFDASLQQKSVLTSSAAKKKQSSNNTLSSADKKKKSKQPMPANNVFPTRNNNMEREFVPTLSQAPISPLLSPTKSTGLALVKLNTLSNKPMVLTGIDKIFGALKCQFDDKYEIVQHLISIGASLDLSTLRYFADEEDYRIIEFLIESGVDMGYNKWIDGWRGSTLQAVVKKKYDRSEHQQHAIRLLFAHGSPIYFIEIMIEAIQAGAYEIVHQLLDRGFDATMKDPLSDETLLIVAARCTILPAVVNITKLLIRAGIKLNEVDHYHNTALDIAIRFESLEVQEVLRQYGARKSSKVVSHYRRSIKKTRHNNSLAIVDDFHERLPDNSSAENYVEVLRYLLEEGTAITASCVDSLQHSLLMPMNAQVLEYMVEMDMDLVGPQQRRIRHSILIEAIVQKRYAAVDRLLWHGATWNDHNAFTLAIKTSFPPVLQVLLDRRLHADYSNSECLMIMATKTGDLSMIKMLVEYHIAIDSTPPAWDYSALREAIKFGRVKLVQYFLANGAALHFNHPEGLTLIHGVSSAKLLQCLLDTQQFDVNAIWHRPNSIYTTPLQAACEQKLSVDVMKILLKHGADASWPETNDIQKSPLTTLLKNFNINGDLETLLLMFNNGAVFVKGVHNSSMKLSRSLTSKQAKGVQEVFDEVVTSNQEIPDGPLDLLAAEKLKTALLPLENYLKSENKVVHG